MIDFLCHFFLTYYYSGFTDLSNLYHVVFLHDYQFMQILNNKLELVLDGGFALLTSST